MKKQLLFVAMYVAMLTACSSSQPNDNQSSSASSLTIEESSLSSLSSESSSIEEAISSESVEESSSTTDLTWSSMEEAIVFYENELTARVGEEMANMELNMEFYERDSWQIIEQSGNTIVLSKNNRGIGGKDRIKFEKGDTTTEMTFFSANSPYPDRPTSRRIVRNSDFVTIESEGLNPIDPYARPYAEDPFDSFTAESAYEYLKKELDIGDDIVVQFSTSDENQYYFELVLVSREIQAQGGGGTVGVYRVYEDKTIKPIKEISGE